MTKSVLFALGLTIFGAQAAHAGPTASETLYLTDASFNGQREFLVSNSRRDGLVQVAYKGSLFKTQGLGSGEYLGDDGPDLYCNNRWVKSLKLGLGTDEVRIPKRNSTCQIRLGSKPVVRFINDESYSSIYKKFGTSYHEECRYSDDGPMTSIRYRNMSCAQAFDDVEILSDSIDSFLVKLEILLGQKLPKSFIDAQDPYAKLDFSKAPKLDAIYVSTLLYQNDFSGQVLGRILKFHAQRGTMVNIIGTGYMHSDNATSLFKELTTQSKNIRIQEYKYFEVIFPPFDGHQNIQMGRKNYGSPHTQEIL